MSELHYDNEGVDVGEAVEVVGAAGSSLAGWSLVFYNGSSGAPYRTLALGGVLPEERGGFGALAFSLPVNGMQNGPDGVALVAPSGVVADWISYEGSFLATAGPAAGTWSQDVLVYEDGDTPAGYSLQRSGGLGGPGTGGPQRGWLAPAPASFGALNAGQLVPGEQPVPLRIAAVQGAAHRSPWEGRWVELSGVVTWVRTNGFHLEDPEGDGESATAEGIFVEARAASEAVVGERVVVEGLVVERAPAGASAASLSVTRLEGAQVVARHGVDAALPAPIVVGPGGRLPPTRVMDDDGLSLFEPEADGLDFWESLEGMRVVLQDAVAVGPTLFGDETFVTATPGAAAENRSQRGALVRTRLDANPERIRLLASARGGPTGGAQLGDRAGDLLGVVDFAFGSFELRADAVVHFVPAAAAPETTALNRADAVLTIGSYNVRNLAPDDGSRLGQLGRHIALHLAAPDVVALQEIQDGDGAVDSGRTDAEPTWLALIEAIVAAGGPRYRHLDRSPEDGADGGRPGANIRVGFLYDPTRVTLDAERSESITGPAFAGSRKPFAIAVERAGRRLLLVAVHLTSRAGSGPAFGGEQPPEVGGAARRLAQAAAMHTWVAARLEADPELLPVVLGDWNAFGWEPPIALFEQASSLPLRSLARRLPASERYSYVWEGSAELLDHVLVDPRLESGARFDVVHLNAGNRFAASDHDPVVARLDLRAVPEPSAGRLAAASLLALALLNRWRSGGRCTSAGRRQGRSARRARGHRRPAPRSAAPSVRYRACSSPRSRGPGRARTRR